MTSAVPRSPFLVILLANLVQRRKYGVVISLSRNWWSLGDYPKQSFGSSFGSRSGGIVTLARDAPHRSHDLTPSLPLSRLIAPPVLSSVGPLRRSIRFRGIEFDRLRLGSGVRVVHLSSQCVFQREPSASQTDPCRSTLRGRGDLRVRCLPNRPAPGWNG
jgi:hypothetical protein